MPGKTIPAARAHQSASASRGHGPLLQGNAPLWERLQLECSRSLPGRTQRRFIDDQNPMIAR